MARTEAEKVSRNGSETSASSSQRSRNAFAGSVYIERDTQILVRQLPAQILARGVLKTSGDSGSARKQQVAPGEDEITLFYEFAGLSSRSPRAALISRNRSPQAPLATRIRQAPLIARPCTHARPARKR